MFNMFEEGSLIIDASVKMCLSDDDHCILDIPIFERQAVPQPLCQNELGFNMKSEKVKQTCSLYCIQFTMMCSFVS
jgi:hypothetical protein